MSAFEVYIEARALEASSPDIWEDAEKLQAVEAQVRDDLGRMYRFLDTLAAQLAELRGPAVLPARPSNRTPKQERVSRCPRCGDRSAAA